MPEQGEPLTMDVSVCICTYNGSKTLPDALRALAEQQTPERLTWEVVLIDNASTDGCGEMCEELGHTLGLPLRVIREERAGLSYARRTALDSARGRLFSFIDDDNFVEPNWVAAVAGFLDAHSDAALVGGRIDPRFEDPASVPTDFDQFAGLLAVRDLGDEPIKGAKPLGAGMSGRTWLVRAVLQEIGLVLDGRKGNALTGGEDHELCQIIKKLGWEMWYTPTMRMEHWMPVGRLQPEYLSKLRLGTARCFAWLRLIGQEQPALSKSGLRRWLAQLRVRSMKYAVMQWLPNGLHERVKEAGFWRAYYTQQALGVRDLLEQFDRAEASLSKIESHRTSLGPGSDPARVESATGRGTAEPDHKKELMTG